MDALSRLVTPEILVPVAGMLMPIAIVLIALAYAQRFQERKHQTIVGLLEKGLPVPRELLRPARSGGSALMRAMTLVGAGLGICGFLGAMFGPSHGLWASGLIPLCIGLAQLIALKFEPARPDVDPPSAIDPL
ncbi:MAG: DUF6249 domain-containing protein [Burkholderiaceae bacterium]